MVVFKTPRWTYFNSVGNRGKKKKKPKTNTKQSNGVRASPRGLSGQASNVMVTTPGADCKFQQCLIVPLSNVHPDVGSTASRRMPEIYWDPEDWP